MDFFTLGDQYIAVAAIESVALKRIPQYVYKCAVAVVTVSGREYLGPHMLEKDARNLVEEIIRKSHPTPPAEWMSRLQGDGGEQR